MKTEELSTVSLDSQTFCFKINRKELFIGRLRIKEYTPSVEGVSLHNMVCKQQRFYSNSHKRMQQEQAMLSRSFRNQS
jgi:hypothetical protein